MAIERLFSFETLDKLIDKINRNFGNAKKDMEVADALKADIAQEAWHEVGAAGEPAFENSWTGSIGSPWANVGFMKDTSGFVHLRGLAQNGTVSAYPGVPMFTLPAGYRPATGHLANVQANGALGRVDILTDGKVNAISPTSNAWVALDGIIFKV
jgi:hypothetical protein